MRRAHSDWTRGSRREGTLDLRSEAHGPSVRFHRLRSPLAAARHDAVTTLLDLSGITFIDSEGLRVLLEAARATDSDEWAWFIVRPSDAVLRLVELSGAAPRLPLVEPHRAAARRVSPAAAARARRGHGRAARHG